MLPVEPPVVPDPVPVPCLLFFVFVFLVFRPWVVLVVSLDPEVPLIVSEPLVDPDVDPEPPRVRSLEPEWPVVPDCPDVLPLPLPVWP